MRNTLPGKVRIIGGRWRSRKIAFPDVPGLRPTHDRIRETLFNWLAPEIENATCLDLFAGSGALGFEALSRGAKHVTFVDSSREAIAALKKNAELLQATSEVDIVHASCPDSLLKFKQAPFDIVFLDPPFFQDLIQASSNWLEKNNYLAKNAWVYLEAERSLSPLPVPTHWELFRQKETSTLVYALFRAPTLA